MDRLLQLSRALVPATLRINARLLAGEMRENSGLARLWRWEVARLSRPDAPYDLLYLGPAEQRAQAAALFAAERVEIVNAQALTTPNVAVASHLPLPGAVHVPTQLRMIIPLDQAIADILAGYHEGLRRRLTKLRSRFELKQVIELSELERLHRDMLAPYAQARHGDGAVTIDLESLRRIARGAGRLDVLTEDGREVGCHLGYPRERDGFVNWISLRYGYPKEIFEDTKRFSDVNSMNLFATLEWAKASGFHAHDLGACVGRPEDGLVQWKRRRGGHPDASWSRVRLNVRLPRAVRAGLLWDHPLFSVEGDRLSMSLGLPSHKTDSEAAARYRELRFNGLASVALHAARAPGPELLESLRALCPAAELYVHPI
jgi:hypothetical protein